MKAEPSSLFAPDRLSTTEEIRWATGSSSARLFEFCLVNTLLGEFRTEPGKPADLTTSDLEFLLSLSEWEAMLVN